MKIYKLDAIDSTNSFLKKMAEESMVENFTVVVAKHQTSGRGQINTQWQVEEGKNLTFSMFVRFSNLEISNQKYLNFAVALSVYEVLFKANLPKVAIKWPNDIMAGGSKICGILVENSLKGFNIDTSVIGIGLNVNESFHTNKEFNATSMKDILQEEVVIEDILNQILEALTENIAALEKKQYSKLENRYLEVLYKKNVPSMFKTDQNVLFMGKIIGVSENGQLQIELADETVQDFGIKEVSFA